MIVEYEEKYLENVKDLLVELEEYILSIDQDHLDQLHPDYRDKMAELDLNEVKEIKICRSKVEKNFLRLISFFPEVCFLMILFLFIFSCAGSSLPPGHFLIAESGDSSLQGLLWVPSSGPRSQAQGLWPVDLAAHSMRDLPGPGIGPVCTLHH